MRVVARHLIDADSWCRHYLGFGYDLPPSFHEDRAKQKVLEEAMAKHTKAEEKDPLKDLLRTASDFESMGPGKGADEASAVVKENDGTGG